MATLTLRMMNGDLCDASPYCMEKHSIANITLKDINGVTMVITLTPEIEQALYEIAEHKGTTTELLVLKTLQENLLSSKHHKASFQKSEKILADFLEGYVGVFDSNEIVNGGAQMSTHVSKQFGDILLQKQN